jgi:hypothetical protein
MVVFEERGGKIYCNGWMIGDCEICEALWCPRDGEAVEDEHELSGRR